MMQQTGSEIVISPNLIILNGKEYSAVLIGIALRFK